MKLKTIDLCAGIGGIRRGFELAGDYTNIASAEIDEMACKTYEHLYHENPYNDVTNEEFKESLQKLHYDRNHDCIYEGPQTSKTSNRSGGVKQRNTTPAMTEQEAKALRGSGYHGTRPKSSAEDTELAAAMNKCRKCGMHTTNGKNSLCDACLYNKNHGLD